MTRVRTRRENEIALFPSPRRAGRGCRAKRDGGGGVAAILSRADKPPHPDLLPARGEKEGNARRCLKVSIGIHRLRSRREDDVPGVIAGHSRSENGVTSLAYVPAIPMAAARHCHCDRDDRDKPGHDEMTKESSLRGGAE